MNRILLFGYAINLYCIYTWMKPWSIKVKNNNIKDAISMLKADPIECFKKNKKLWVKLVSKNYIEM